MGKSAFILWEIALISVCRFGEYMQYWGKIIGVAVALIMAAALGVVLGLLIGHMFDKARSRKMAWFANQRERQALFFCHHFEVMGHLTKSKGRVTEADIHIASQLMDRMNLHGASRTAAQNAFRVGKSDNYFRCAKRCASFAVSALVVLT